MCLCVLRSLHVHWLMSPKQMHHNEMVMQNKYLFPIWENQQKIHPWEEGFVWREGWRNGSGVWETHSVFPCLCVSNGRAEACGLSRILNAALTMNLGGTSRSHRRELCEWKSERKKKRRGSRLREERASKASWKQNADSPRDACISSCFPASKLRGQENISVTEALVFLSHTLFEPRWLSTN